MEDLRDGICLIFSCIWWTFRFVNFGFYSFLSVASLSCLLHFCVFSFLLRVISYVFLLSFTVYSAICLMNSAFDMGIEMK